MFRHKITQNEPRAAAENTRWQQQTWKPGTSDTLKVKLLPVSPNCKSMFEQQEVHTLTATGRFHLVLGFDGSQPFLLLILQFFPTVRAVLCSKWYFPNHVLKGATRSLSVYLLHVRWRHTQQRVLLWSWSRLAGPEGVHANAFSLAANVKVSVLKKGLD